MASSYFSRPLESGPCSRMEEHMQEKNTVDTNSQLEIRKTDNTPKEGDDFQLNQQFNRPMTDEEILAKFAEVTG